MDKPRVRWIEAIPMVHEGKELILLRDSEGITQKNLVVSREIAYMISLMDGSRSLHDVQLDFMRAVGELVYIEKIEELVKTMDSHLLLFNENYKRRFSEVRSEYENSSTRKAFLAGKSYAENRMDLLTFLDEMLGNESDGNTEHEITGLLAPHIDYPRGVSVYRKTYPHLKHNKKPLLVIFGTCHHPTERLLSISLKDFETPIERIPHASELDSRIRDDEILKDYIDEWPHRNEHSIELQLPLIQFVMQHDFEILPILTGSMHEYVQGKRSLNDGEIDNVVEGVRNVLSTSGRPYVILSGADLAHIGAQFGDSFELDESELARSKRQDEILLNEIKNVNPDGFFKAVQEESDSRRICGLTPIYFQLKLLEGGRCEIVGYDQWTDGKSSVSFAGGVFYRAENP